MNAVYMLILQQSEMIKKISLEVQETYNKILQSTGKSLKTETDTETINEESTTLSLMMRFLCGNTCNHSFSLQLASDIPHPAYKERVFSLILNIVDLNGVKVHLQQNYVFKIMLYTADNPPKLLMINTSGVKIIRGTTEIEGNSIVIFKKIVVNEVSSHFRNGSFFLVVMAKDIDFIKPFVFPEFVVKARKTYKEFPKKKFKVDKNDRNPDDEDSQDN
ncbi:hypothetical protein SteCoe_12614 [Stentor coeruleus]|uniref:Uncharacterized protein n=1 Tax=Stentor coeruleus TaxID=5963 RepID=A0A1R2CAF0_9CILI|nr:hypothetical protein SteCoe_12614 [Stentor coeruleus]